MKYSIVITTCPNREQAQILAKSLLAEHLAACVQLSDISSLYHWNGKLCDEPEVRLTIKTRSELYDALEKYISEKHEYDVPEIIMLPIEKGSAAYLDWIGENTAPQQLAFLPEERVTSQ